MGDPIKPRLGGPTNPGPVQAPSNGSPAPKITDVQRSVAGLLDSYNEHFGTDRARITRTARGFSIFGAIDLTVADVQHAIRGSGDSRYTGHVTIGDDGGIHVRLVRREGQNQVHPEPRGEVGVWKSLIRRPVELPGHEPPARPLMVDAAPFGPHAALPRKA